MKRLVVRIAALLTVVVLGLIAIAQAQRGTHEKAANAAPVSAAAAPAVLQPPSDANPLRSETPRRVTAEPAGVVPTAAEVPTQRPVDPFGLRENRTPAAPPPAVQPDRPKDEIPDASALDAPTNRMMAEGPRYPQLNGAAKAKPPADPPAADAAAGDRYSKRMPSSPARQNPGPDEPAPFKADPFTAPTSIAHNDTPAKSDFAMPAEAPDAAAANNEGTGQPGNKALEGPQSPQVSIEKVAPKEIQVGKPATFKVTVRNVGQTAAAGVEVHDQIPKGTRLMNTNPRAGRGVHGELVWTLGTLKPGEEASAEVQLMPTAEGEIGSVATVHFNAEASARVTATKPELAVQVTAPNQALIGEEVKMSITVSNTGTGVATGVMVEEHIPAGLQHAAGSDLEYEIGDLPPGGSRQLELSMIAAKAGPLTNVLNVRGEGSLRAEHRLNIDVIAPQLDIAVGGPKRRYLDREATYEFAVSNPGTAPAKQIELVAYLPTGLKFVSANNAGHYEEADRTVHWRLEELPTKEKGSVEMVAMPIEAGQHKIRLRGTAQRGLDVEKEQPVTIEGIAAVLFQVAATHNPIEVGGETTYEIKVVNQGSKAASNLRLAVNLPPELKPLGADGPTRYAIDGNRVVFEGLARLAPKADTTYQVRAQGLQPGDLRTRVQLLTDEMQTPVTKEESTQVYADEK